MTMEDAAVMKDGLSGGIVSRLKKVRRTIIRSYHFWWTRHLIHESNTRLKIILGAGGAPVRKGWIATDVDILDMTNEQDWNSLFRGAPIDALLAEHVWEHLPPTEATTAAANCFKHLRHGGHLRVAVPDGYHPDPEYIANVRPGEVGSPSEDHKILYTYQTLRQTFESVGFVVDLLEYWDEGGFFHTNDWEADDGEIKRSARHQTSRSSAPGYTSIILDARKV